MMNATWKKLSEAEFFYRKLLEADGRIIRTEPESADFYLSALLAAGRSVGDVVNAEEGDRYRAWWAQREATVSPDERRLLRVMNDQRVKTIHVRGAEATTEASTVSLAGLYFELATRGGGDVQMLPEFERYTLVLDDYPGEPAYRVCRRYLEFMRSVLAEYEQHVAVAAR